jgi:hypothetical protein
MIIVVVESIIRLSAPSSYICGIINKPYYLAGQVWPYKVWQWLQRVWRGRHVILAGRSGGWPFSLSYTTPMELSNSVHGGCGVLHSSKKISTKFDRLIGKTLRHCSVMLLKDSKHVKFPRINNCASCLFVIS